MSELWAYSIYGAQSRKGLVKLVKDKEVIATVTPDEARHWAMNLIQAAEAAETDEFLMYVFQAKVKLDEASAVKMLEEFRGYREKERE